MTSIHLPPLSFDEGSFRVSIITGSSSTPANDVARTEPNTISDPGPESEHEPEAKQDSEPEAESGTEQTTEPSRSPPPPPAPERAASRPEPPKLEVDVQAQPKPQTQLQSSPELEIRFKPSSYSDSDSDEEPELTPIAVAHPVPISAPPPPPIPQEPVYQSSGRPISAATLGDAATILVGDHHVEDMPQGHSRSDSSPPQPAVPSHPIGALQRAFAESLEEVTNGGADKPQIRELDAKGRRERLLEQQKDEEPFDARWRYRPGQTQHELLKLIAQISFGVYLLLNGMANDNSQVISILQGHIDEVDEFLEVTLEDFDQATGDLKERIEYLELPMSNIKVFEEMLEDRNYRAEILEGNEKIEQVLERMNVVMKQWDDDIDGGLQGTTAFNDWLNSVKNGSWRQDQPGLTEIFDAMKGNADGWINAFDEMNVKIQELNVLIVKLMSITTEMEKKAGEVSRKTWSSIQPFTSPTSGSLKSRRDNSSISSPPSIRSNPLSATRVSVRSISNSQNHAFGSDDELDDGLGEFPLPGVAPLLPPTRNSTRLSKKLSIESPKLSVDTAPKPSPVAEATPEEEREDSPLYLLQPRTYTPQPPEPLPSPVVRDSPTSPSSPRRRHEYDQAPIPVDARSLNQRVSSPRHEMNRVSSPRQDVHQVSSPRQDVNRVSSPRHEMNRVSSPRQEMNRVSSPRQDPRISNDPRNRPGSRASPIMQSPGMASPRRSNQSNLKLTIRDSNASSNHQLRDSHASSTLQVRDSNGSSMQMRDSSGSEMEGFRTSRMPRVGSHADLRPTRPTLMQSPNSDYQHYHPVLASPHSPLQQRPHTAAGPRPSSAFPHQPRPQPSRLGSMATLDTVPSDVGERGTMRPSAPSVAGAQTLKKKKSAFGWFKKAFTMDDEERAAFEARKMMQQPDNYYKDKDPKFLDGRRMR